MDSTVESAHYEGPLVQCAHEWLVVPGELEQPLAALLRKKEPSRSRALPEFKENLTPRKHSLSASRERVTVSAQDRCFQPRAQFDFNFTSLAAFATSAATVPGCDT